MDVSRVGTIIQLASKTELDEEIHKNAKGDIDLFKSDWKRYTHFETENMMTSKKVQFGSTCIFEIDNGVGDLISNLMLKIKLPVVPNNTLNNTKEAEYRCWTNKMIYSMIKNITIKHGSNVLLILDANSLLVRSELNVSSSKQKMHDVMYGNHHTIQSMIEYTYMDDVEYYIDIQLMIHNDQSQFFPIINAKNTDSKLMVYVTLREMTKLMLKSVYYNTDLRINDDYSNINNEVEISLMSDYILLSRDEAISLLTSDNDFLLENMILNEFTNIKERNALIEDKFQLTFTHVTKELIIVVTRKDDEDNNIYHEYIEIDNIELYIDGNKLNEEVEKKYPNGQKIFNIHKNKRTPRYNIYTLSFALSPGMFQPTGHLNFSNVNSAFIKIRLKQLEEVIVRVYSVELKIYKINSNGDGKYEVM